MSNQKYFRDYFSNHAGDYAAYRPTYPAALFSYLAQITPDHQLAWDCGTGNGQAAVELAKDFKQVIASDPSAEQIKAATPKTNIMYRVFSAEQTDLTDNSVDLITVAQALHWFDFAKFYAEAKRVLKPNGVIAAWCYSLTRVDPAVDAIIDHFYWNIIPDYWDPRRKLIDEEYKTIPFPFNKIITPVFQMEQNWDLLQFINYINTWSGLKAYIKQKGVNPLEQLFPQLVAAWGTPTTVKTVCWPLHLLVGKT